MSETRQNKTRSQPILLVVVLLAIVALSAIFQLLISRAWSWVAFSTNMVSPMGFSILISLTSQLLSFPFMTTCVVWLAARSGRTDWSTWTIPLCLIVSPGFYWLAWLVSTVVLPVSNYGGFGFDTMIYFFWMNTLRPNLFTFAILTFLFFTTTLHLRPVEVASSPRRLTVFSMLLLTALIASVLGIDSQANSILETTSRQDFMVESNNLMYGFEILYACLWALSSALVWFASAWLLVADNPKRWIGIASLIAYVFLMAVLCLVISPLQFSSINANAPLGVTPFGHLYFIASFVVAILHIPVVFLCVGMMHLAGYRWDIFRPLAIVPKSTFESIAGEPPLLDSNTRIDL